MSGRLTPHQIDARTMEQTIIFQKEQTVIRMEEDSKNVKKADKMRKFLKKRMQDLKEVKMKMKIKSKLRKCRMGRKMKNMKGL